MSVRAMFEPNAPAEPYVFDTGFAHDADMVGAFEAPSLSAALAGTVRLEQAGWARRFATEWLLGPREFSTVQGRGERTDHSWGFLALWEWNDAWSAATKAERRAYDEECDVAFKGDVALGINIAGRHRLDWASRWHHAGLWEAPSLGSDRPRHARPRGGGGFQVHDLATLCRPASPACRLHRTGRGLMHERVHLDPLCEAETALVRARRRDPGRPRKGVGDGGGTLRSPRAARVSGRYHIRGQQDFETVEIWTISQRGGRVRALVRADRRGLRRIQRVREQYRSLRWKVRPDVRAAARSPRDHSPVRACARSRSAPTSPSRPAKSAPSSATTAPASRRS